MLSCRHLRKTGFLCVVAPALAQQLDEWTVTYFDRAMEAQWGNDLQTAESEYRLITNRNPRFAGAFLNLGIV